MKRRDVLCMPVALLAKQPPPDYSALQDALTKYVTADGKVRYAALKADLAELDRFVAGLKTFDAAQLQSREAKLAHWINVYNALILWSFAKDYPREKDRLKGALSRAAYFYRRKFSVGGTERSLSDIEDNSIRKAFREPRIHFAIVCASASCPWLSREVYTEMNVLAKLDAEATRFLNQERNVLVDAAKRQVTVSQIFKWFRDDFGGTDASILAFIGRYSKAVKPDFAIRYFGYDWSINDTANKE